MSSLVTKKLKINKISFIISLIFIISIKPYEVTQYSTKLDSSIADVVWCGKNKDTIFVLTQNLNVYKSKDNGKTWLNLEQTLTQTANKEKEKEIIGKPVENIKEKAKEETETGKVGRIKQSPIDPSLLIFIGTQQISWIVENCGDKITANILGRPVSDWVFHPIERNWALVSADSVCEDFINSGEPCRIVRELYVTQTLGNDWKLLGDYIKEYAWGVNSLNVKKGIPKERILLTYLPGGRGSQKKTVAYSYKYDFVYSDNFFRTKIVGVRKSSKFFIKNDVLYVAQVEDQELQIITLLRANLSDTKFVFDPIKTNQQHLKNHSFKFLDSSGSGIFLYINNLGKNVRFGNIYTSDIEGKEFALSLKNNINLGNNDFEAIMGVTGLYLANVVSGKYIKLSKQQLYSSIQERVLGKKTGGKEQKEKKKSDLIYKNYAKTLITHNQGGDWKRLTPPERDSQGNSYNCKDHCSLHLYSYSSNKPIFYTIDNAVGVIIGNGNVGRYLDYNYQNIALFLSRDGGNTWYEIKKGAYIYEIGDHGGLIVIAKYNTLTKYISYTYDEGITWDELKISDEEIYIKNILNDPSSSGQKFLVYGSTKSNIGENEGILISLDFSSLYVRKCSASDYETWSPRSITQTDKTQFCIMGESITYQRRKRNSKCVNGENFVTSLSRKICECTEDDYQCDVGFHRNEPGDPCSPVEKKTQEEMFMPPQDCNGYYIVSKGYRIIPGNKCSGLDKYKPIKIQCPYNKFAYFCKILVILGVICGIGYGVYFIRTYTNIEFKEIWEVIISLIPSVDLSFGGEKTSYLSTNDDYDDEKDYGFEQEQKAKKKKKKKGKNKNMKSGDVTIDTQNNLSNNLTVL